MKTCIMTFGRFNPPTVGHEKLINKAKALQEKMGGDLFVFVSKSQKTPRDPVPYHKKLSFLKKCFRGVIFPKIDTVRTPFDVLKHLSDKGYKRVFFVTGSDRIKEFETKIRKYINHDNPELSLNFDQFQMINAGKRNPDTPGITGVSGTKMREFAKNNDFESFKKFSPSFASEKDIKDIYKEIKVIYK